MIHRVLKIGRWIVDFLFAERGYDIDGVVACLRHADASPSVIERAVEIMEKGRMNTGFTCPNPRKRVAVVVIGPSSSGEQFLNTFVHEVRHLADSIAKSIGYELDSEPPAYLSGDAALALADVVCQLGCSSHSRNCE